MNSLWIVCITGGLYIAGYLYVLYLKHQVKEQEKKAEIARQEALAIAEEMENAEKRKQIEQANQRLTNDAVDKQLHERSYFRD